MRRQGTIHTDFLDSLRPLFAGQRKCDPEHFFGPAVRDYWILHYIVSGKGVYKTQQNTYEVTSGKAFIIKPGEVTVYTADKHEPWHYVWLAFKAEEENFDLPYVIENKSLGTVMERLSREDRFEEGAHYYFVSAFFEIMDCLVGNSSSARQSYVENAVNIMKLQYMTDISVLEISKRLGLERSYFSNLFKAETGKSPKQYLTDYRMKIALSMLRREKYTVSVVASSVGYGDVFGFSRYFKKYYGVSPSRYKQIR